jgi:hypothetical protein
MSPVAAEMSDSATAFFIRLTLPQQPEQQAALFFMSPHSNASTLKPQVFFQFSRIKTTLLPHLLFSP